MKPEILQIASIMPSVDEALASAFTVHRYWENTDKDAFLDASGGKIRGFVTIGHHGAPPEILDRLPALEIVASYGVGYDPIDTDDCKARNLRVTNTPGVLNDAVAELAVGMIVGLCRRIPNADAYVRSGQWPQGNFALTQELTGSHAGIVGLGRIGKEIAQRLLGFKMKVSYFGRREQAYQPYDYYPNLVDMARDVDWLVAITPGTPETKGLVSREVMKALGPSGAVVNVARGPVVDETALVELLQSGELGGAALDVFEKEPSVPDALLRMENVLLSPHQASATHKTRNEMGALVIANLVAHFEGQPLPSAVV